MASSFSTSGEDALTKTLDVQLEHTPLLGTPEFEEYYEIERTAREIEEGNYHRIALQFPDELLHDSVPVYRRLRGLISIGRDLYVLADTSYGSCCVDEVAASHVDADLVVHYGHACLSQASRLPVVYVFGRKNISIEDCVEKIARYVDQNCEQVHDIQTVLLRHAAAYTHVANNVVRTLKNRFPQWSIQYDPPPVRTVSASDPQALHPGAGTAAHSLSSNMQNRKLNGDCEENANTHMIIWLGDESATLTRILMTSNGCLVIAYSSSAESVTQQSQLTNRLLMRRYALIQQARDADVFGILVGTLGVANYLPLLSHLRKTLKKARKKSYTVSVGKINPSKLANFLEIECWVWVACSEGMVDSKEFLKPIISPYELEIALQPEPHWTGKYVLDFNELLINSAQQDLSQSGTRTTGEEDSAHDDEMPMFSMVTGKYRHAKRYGIDSALSSAPETQAPDGTVVLRNRDTALSKRDDRAAATFLRSRTYQGLELRLGQDEPSVLEQGRDGIARGYVDDHLVS